QARLPLHGYALEGGILRLGLLGINVGGQPQTRLHVDAPAVEMEVELALGIWAVGSVEANNVEILIFYPDATQKVRRLVLAFRNHVNYARPAPAQKLAAQVSEFVMLLIEMLVQKHHLQKADVLVVHPEEAVQPVENLIHECRAIIVFESPAAHPFWVEHES